MAKAKKTFKPNEFADAVERGDIRGGGVKLISKSGKERGPHRFLRIEGPLLWRERDGEERWALMPRLETIIWSEDI